MEVTTKAATGLTGMDAICNLAMHGSKQQTMVRKIEQGIATWNAAFNFTGVTESDNLTITCLAGTSGTPIGEAKLAISTYFATLKKRPSYLMQQQLPLLKDNVLVGQMQVQIKCPKIAAKRVGSGVQSYSETIIFKSTAAFDGDAPTGDAKVLFETDFKQQMANRLSTGNITVSPADVKVGAIIARSNRRALAAGFKVEFEVDVAPQSAKSTLSAFQQVQTEVLSVGGMDASISDATAFPAARDSGACTSNQFESPGGCIDLSACKKSSTSKLLEWESSPATAKSDRKCTKLTTCTEHQFVSKEPTPTFDRECGRLSTCASDEYDSGDQELAFVQTAEHAFEPTYLKDRACKPLTACVQLAQFEATPPTATADRVCAEVTQCTPQQYADKDATFVTDRVCKALTVCGRMAPSTTAAPTVARAGKTKESTNSTAFSNTAPGITAVPNTAEPRTTVAPAAGSLLSYESVAATPLSDRICKRVTACRHDTEFEAQAPTVTSDRVCSAISHPVPASVVDGGGTYEVAASTPTSDAVIRNVTICSDDQYQCGSPSAIQDRICCATSVPSSSQYICQSANRTANARICNVTKLACYFPEEFELQPMTMTSDRICQETSTCSPLLRFTYEVKAPTTSSDRVCGKISVCTPNEFESEASSETSDRKCSPFTACQPGTFERQAPTPTSDRVCAAADHMADAPCMSITGARIAMIEEDGTKKVLAPPQPVASSKDSTAPDCCKACAADINCKGFEYKEQAKICSLMGVASANGPTDTALALTVRVLGLQLSAAAKDAIPGPADMRGAPGVTSGWVIEQLRESFPPPTATKTTDSTNATAPAKTTGALVVSNTTAANTSTSGAHAAASSNQSVALNGTQHALHVSGLHVTLRSGSSLPTAFVHRIFGQPAMSCSLAVGAITKETSEVAGRDPVWGEEFVFSPAGSDAKLDIVCSDKVALQGKVKVGSVALTLADIRERQAAVGCKSFSQTPLLDASRRSQGYLQLSFGCGEAAVDPVVRTLPAAQTPGMLANFVPAATVAAAAGSEGEDVIAGEGTPAAPAPAGNAITTKAPGAFATRAPGSSVFDDCALERVSTLQAAMECTEKLEATYASIEAGGGSKDERDAKLSLASDLINKIARKAEAFPHGAEDR
jgi:hypothetical protein